MVSDKEKCTCGANYYCMSFIRFVGSRQCGKCIEATYAERDALTAEVEKLKGRIAEFIDGESSDGD